VTVSCRDGRAWFQVAQLRSRVIHYYRGYAWPIHDVLWIKVIHLRNFQGKDRIDFIETVHQMPWVSKKSLTSRPHAMGRFADELQQTGVCDQHYTPVQYVQRLRQKSVLNSIKHWTRFTDTLAVLCLPLSPEHCKFVCYFFLLFLCHFMCCTKWLFSKL